MKKEKKNEMNVNHTFALGFSVDFSEDKEPIEELGVKPVAVEAEVVPM